MVQSSRQWDGTARQWHHVPTLHARTMLGMMVPNGRSYDMASKDAWNAVHLQCEELMRMEVFPNFAQGRGNCLRPWIMILHIPRCVTAKSQKGWCQCNKMISYSPRLMVVSVCWANSTSWLIGEYISRYVHQGGATHFSIAKTFFLCGGWFITRDCFNHNLTLYC